MLRVGELHVLTCAPVYEMSLVLPSELYLQEESKIVGYEVYIDLKLL